MRDINDRRRWQLIIGGVILAFIVLAVIGSWDEPSESPPASAPTVSDNPVVNDINSMTDCAALQAEFDQAAENNEREEPGSPLFELSLLFMETAHERMAEVGCYD